MFYNTLITTCLLILLNLFKIDSWKYLLFVASYLYMWICVYLSAGFGYPFGFRVSAGLVLVMDFHPNRCSVRVRVSVLGARRLHPIRTRPVAILSGSSRVTWKQFWMAAGASHGNIETTACTPASYESCRLYKWPFGVALCSFFSLPSPLNPVRDRRWWWGVVSDETASFPGRLPLCFPAPDLLARGAAPSSLLGLWGRRSSSSFVFLGSNGAPGVGADRIYFLSVQICFFFVTSSASSQFCASRFLRRPPQGEIDPKSDYVMN
jgi:hypothetical protein